MQNNNVNSLLTSESPLWLENFLNVYHKLSTNNLDLLAKLYHPDVIFIDPIHKVKGLDELHHYFKNLYDNLIACDFVIEEIILENDQAAIYWKMSYIHPKLNKGKTVSVQGNSHIKGIDDKVIYHRDYLDLGAMLYEQIPAIGSVIQWLKKRASH
ncbi:nuclear transport factor 2 family protein [Thalassotalea piscium]